MKTNIRIRIRINVMVMLRVRSSFIKVGSMSSLRGAVSLGSAFQHDEAISQLSANGHGDVILYEQTRRAHTCPGLLRVEDRKQQIQIALLRNYIYLFTSTYIIVQHI